MNVFCDESKIGRKLKGYSNIAADMNFSNSQSLISLIIFVWLLWLSTNLTFVTKDVYYKICKKIVQAVFF